MAGLFLTQWSHWPCGRIWPRPGRANRNASSCPSSHRTLSLWSVRVLQSPKTQRNKRSSVTGTSETWFTLLKRYGVDSARVVSGQCTCPFSSGFGLWTRVEAAQNNCPPLPLTEECKSWQTFFPSLPGSSSIWAYAWPQVCLWLGTGKLMPLVSFLLTVGGATANKVSFYLTHVMCKALWGQFVRQDSSHDLVTNI